MNVQEDYPLARLTTLRAGGNAELFSRPATEDALIELLAWARERQKPVEVVEKRVTQTKAPHFVEYVRRFLLERYGSEMLYTGGLRVYTTLDLEMQRKAEEAIQEWVKPRGVGVVVEAMHFCMIMRGVEKQNSVAVTSCMLGDLRDLQPTRGETVRYTSLISSSLLGKYR